MEGTVKCASCGSAKNEIGEGTIFCCGCNAALGTVNGKIKEFDLKMVLWEDAMRGVFARKGDPKEVAEEFGGTRLNHGIALNAMDLKAQLDEANHLAENLRWELRLTHDRILSLEAELYKRKELQIGVKAPAPGQPIPTVEITPKDGD